MKEKPEEGDERTDDGVRACADGGVDGTRATECRVLDGDRWTLNSDEKVDWVEEEDEQEESLRTERKALSVERSEPRPLAPLPCSSR